MKIYLVGGAVRDHLLGLSVHERDFVVVGGSTSMMLDAGFKRVGKDFPVFLHPQTGEEYALARRERKVGLGYHGFTCDTSVSVTLEEDLLRRDLTVNAMAMDENGTVIDPYGGQADLKNRYLRHVSSAFVEDPLRVLRVARFAARFASLGFQIAPETSALMMKMVRDRELLSLTVERVWQEYHRALASASPRVFIEVLRSVGALKQILPEFDALFGVPHRGVCVDVGRQMLMEMCDLLLCHPQQRFAISCLHLGKGRTPMEDWPEHPEAGRLGLEVFCELQKRLRVPKSYETLARLVIQYTPMIQKLTRQETQGILALFKGTDAWRRPDRFYDLLKISEVVHKDTLKTEMLLKCRLKTEKVAHDCLGLSGEAMKQAIDARRIMLLEEKENDEDET